MTHPRIKTTVGHQFVTGEERAGGWADPATDRRSWLGLDTLVAFLVGGFLVVSWR